MPDRSPAPGSLALIETLVNTLDIETGEDALDRPETRQALGVTDVEAARELRESLRAVLLSHAGHPPHREVTPLSDLLAAAPLLLKATPDGTLHLEPADPAPLLSRVAAAITESLLTTTWPRLKACESPTCHWAYYDRSPAARSRWCSMQVCGARAKMRRYRAKDT